MLKAITCIAFHLTAVARSQERNDECLNGFFHDQAVGECERCSRFCRKPWYREKEFLCEEHCGIRAGARTPYLKAQTTTFHPLSDDFPEDCLFAVLLSLIILLVSAIFGVSLYYRRSKMMPKARNYSKNIFHLSEGQRHFLNNENCANCSLHKIKEGQILIKTDPFQSNKLATHCKRRQIAKWKRQNVKNVQPGGTKRVLPKRAPRDTVSEEAYISNGHPNTKHDMKEKANYSPLEETTDSSQQLRKSTRNVNEVLAETTERSALLKSNDSKNDSVTHASSVKLLDTETSKISSTYEHIASVQSWSRNSNTLTKFQIQTPNTFDETKVKEMQEFPSRSVSLHDKPMKESTQSSQQIEIYVDENEAIEDNYSEPRVVHHYSREASSDAGMNDSMQMSYSSEIDNNTSEVIIEQPRSGFHYDENDYERDLCNFQLPGDRNPYDENNIKNNAPYIDIPQENAGYLPANYDVVERSYSNDSGAGSIVDPEFQERSGFNDLHAENNPIYQQLQNLPWVMGYHSQGRSISVYANLDQLDEEQLHRQLVEVTGQPREKFKMRQNTIQQ